MTPERRQIWQRFATNRRALLSAAALTLIFVVSLFSELVANDRPLVLYHGGQWYFPVLFFYPAGTFADADSIAPDYKKLLASPAFAKAGGWAWMPPIPFGPNENIPGLGAPPPTPPTVQNWLGTDDRGRDLAARLLYGFRNSMLFALVSWFFILALGYGVGAVQGYFGGRVDFFIQRLTEIWHALPVLYVILFLLSVFPSSLWLLALVWVAFSWVGLAGYVRAEVLRVRKQEYIAAAQALGASPGRILFRHVLPNALTPGLTLSPFLISASIGSLAALDYLGLGLPPPTASWGELLRQGKENLSSWWLAFFPFFSLFCTLLLLNFVGEGVREALGRKSKGTTKFRQAIFG